VIERRSGYRVVSREGMVQMTTPALARKIAASSRPRWFYRPSNPVLTALPHQARTVPDGPVPIPAQTPSTPSTLAAVEEAKWEIPTGVVGCGAAVQQRQDHRLPVADHTDTAFL
jgi:hypothetical protein